MPAPRTPHPDPSDDSDPDMPLPPDSPAWAKLLEQSNRQASKDRRENTAAIKDLAAEMHEHNTAAATRHVEMTGKLESIRAAVAAVDQAVDEVASEKSALRRSVEAGAKELWSAFKTPIAGLVTAACAYWGWHFFQVPVTPSPVAVTLEAATAPTSPAEPWAPAEAPTSGAVAPDATTPAPAPETEGLHESPR